MADAPIGSPVVEVRGEATLRGLPDLATLSVGVRASARRAEDVTELLARRAAQVRAVIEQHQAAVETTSSTGIQVGPVFERGGVLRPRGYDGTVSSTVVLHDFTALAPLIVELAAVEQCELNGPSWTLRRDNPMYRSARLAAIEDARQRAEDYAGAFGARITGLESISDLEPAPSRFMARAAFARGGMSEPPQLELEPEEQEVTGRVTLRFTISEPDLGAVPDDPPTTVADPFEPPDDAVPAPV